MCPETNFVVQNSLIHFIHSFLFLSAYRCVVYPFFSGKVARMSFGSSPTQFYERRKKSQRDVGTSEAGSRNCPPRRQSKRIVHMDFPRGHMHIDTEIVEEDPMESSDDESIDDQTYRMSLVPQSENSVEDDVESNDSGLRQEIEEEEEGVVEGTLNPQSRRRAPFNHSPTIQSPPKPLSYHVTSYKGKGATKQVKKLRKIDLRSQQRNASDYRFHTHFQQDLYETVIMDRSRIVLEAQWVDWHHMEEQQDRIHNQVIAACESHHLKHLMGVHYDWNKEVIAQFYATLYIDEVGGVRRMHWTTEGEWYNISYDDVASRFSFGAVDAHRPRLHIHNPLDEDEMKFIYAM
jgi:hypothetical protein